MVSLLQTPAAQAKLKASRSYYTSTSQLANTILPEKARTRNTLSGVVGRGTTAWGNSSGEETSSGEDSDGSTDVDGHPSISDNMKHQLLAAATQVLLNKRKAEVPTQERVHKTDLGSSRASGLTLDAVEDDADMEKSGDVYLEVVAEPEPEEETSASLTGSSQPDEPLINVSITHGTVVGVQEPPPPGPMSPWIRMDC